VETGPRIPKEVRGLLHELAAAWADVADCRALEVVQLKGAMTNEVYQVRWAQRCGRRRIKYPRRGSGDGGRHNAGAGNRWNLRGGGRLVSRARSSFLASEKLGIWPALLQLPE
jgi:hypothetical protein